MNTFTRLIFAVSVIAVAGCAQLPGGDLGATFNAESYLKAEHGGDGFDGALAGEYAEVARRAAFRDVRWHNATAYISKARAAESGRTPAPWSPEELGVGGKAAVEYDAVVGIVNAGKSSFPAECARAQVMWDQYLEALRGGDKYCIAPADAKALLDEALAVCTASTEYTVFFGFDSTDLTERARVTLDEVATVSRVLGGAEMSIVGHTDTVGSSAYNQDLSERRARRVADALTDRDIPIEIVTLAGRGFDEPALPTGPNVREPKNRRVEIALSK